MSSGVIEVGSEVFVVPAGKRVVIEQFGFQMIEPNSPLTSNIEAMVEIIVTQPDNTTRVATLAMEVEGTEIFHSGRRNLTASEQVTLYADEGEFVRIQIVIGPIDPVPLPDSFPVSLTANVLLVGQLVVKS